MGDPKPLMSQVCSKSMGITGLLSIKIISFLFLIADGFARAEAAVAILVQKEKDAKRNYARVVNIRSSTDGFKHEGVMYPSRKMQERLLRESYQQAGIDPATVTYIEAHGTGTPTGDPEELNSLHSVFCKGKTREKPLLLGSIKTNMGHTEAAAGLCGMAKVIGAIQTGTIPKTLFFNKPKPEEEHLFDGSMQVKLVSLYNHLHQWDMI